MNFQEFNQVVQVALKVKLFLCERNIDQDVAIAFNMVTIQLAHPHTTREIAHDLRRQVGIKKIKKRKPYEGSTDIIYTGETKTGVGLNIRMNNVCRVVGYKDELVPATAEEVIPKKTVPAKPSAIKKVPVWDCVLPEEEA